MIGVYKILNKVDGKFYIGSSIDIEKRFKSHVYCLNRNIHNNKYLQSAWNKYGSSNFEFLVVEEIFDVDILRERETYYLNTTNCTNHEIGYNLLNDATIGFGVHASSEVRKKISDACKGTKNGNYGRKHTKEEIEIMRNNRWGLNYVCKPPKPYKRKTLEELQESHGRFIEKCKGRKLSDATRRKISESHRGKKASDELRKKFSDNRKGVKNSNCKLTKEQVMDIYTKMNNGVHYKDICKEYNIGQTLAYKIKRKEHWVFYDK